MGSELDVSIEREAEDASEFSSLFECENEGSLEEMALRKKELNQNGLGNALYFVGSSLASVFDASREDLPTPQRGNGLSTGSHRKLGESKDTHCASRANTHKTQSTKT